MSGMVLLAAEIATHNKSTAKISPRAFLTSGKEKEPDFNHFSTSPIINKIINGSLGKLRFISEYLSDMLSESGEVKASRYKIAPGLSMTK